MPSKVKSSGWQPLMMAKRYKGKARRPQAVPDVFVNPDLSHLNSAALRTAPTPLSQNVLLYEFTSKAVPRFAAFIGVTSLLFWGYTAYMAATGFIMTPMQSVKKVWGKDDEKDRRKREQQAMGFATFSVMAGLLTAWTTWFFPRRVVTRLTLLKDATHLRLTTYNGLGYRSLTVPHTMVHAMQPRGNIAKGGHWPVKVEGHRLFFILDTTGTFHSKTKLEQILEA